MTRSVVSTIVAGILVLLTWLTFELAEREASTWFLAGVALVKILLIGVVFLEMHRSRLIWTVLSISLVVAVVGGSAWLTVG